jgi:hypothetical protein
MSELTKLAFIQNYIISAIATSGARGQVPPKPHELVDEAEDMWNEIWVRHSEVRGIMHEASENEAQVAPEVEAFSESNPEPRVRPARVKK